MIDRLKSFFNEHIEPLHIFFKILIFTFGILGTFEFLMEGLAFLTGSNDALAWNGFDPWMDWFLLLPVIFHFYFYHKEKLPLFTTFTTPFSVGLFIKHVFVSTDPAYGWSKYLGLVLGAAVAVYLIVLFLLKPGKTKKDVTKQEIKPAQEVNYGPYPLKLDEAGKVMIPTESLDMHVHILGGTGSGKSRNGIYPWINQTIVEHKLGCFIYDVKSNMARNTLYYAKQANRMDDLLYFNLLHPELSLTWNPLAEGSPTEIANRVFCSLYYESDPSARYYYELASAVLNNLVPLLMKEYPVINFQMLFDCLNDLRDMKELRKLCDRHRDTNEAKYFENNWISKTLKQKQEELGGLLNKLQRFCNRDWSPLINSLEPDITLKDVITNGKIFYFGVANSKYPDDARALSILAIMNLSESLTDRFERKPEKPFRVFLDEFYNAAYNKFVDLINKARDAKIEFFLSHQDFSDLNAVNKDFARQISSNARTKVFFSIDDPETAEYAASVFGTVEDKDTKVFSYDTRETPFARPAGYTMPDGRKFRVDPDSIKELPDGYAFVKIRFKHGPEYYQLQMMDSLKFSAPQDFDPDKALPKRDKHKLKVESLKKEVRDDLLTGRTPRAKPNFEKLNALATAQLKAKPKPPSQTQI